MEEDCQVLDTVLALEVTFIAPAALPLATALPGPWQHTRHPVTGPPCNSFVKNDSLMNILFVGLKMADKADPGSTDSAATWACVPVQGGWLSFLSCRISVKQP
ncbi:hypothetical protein Y1Q_0008517 [Alligator mississippiensis]|uniref:Uncharacterized protein n=1 Tax=Alligator mississippiensis TaxID=8496 RepID=A0A151M1L4_ALLMI|nr:hypothetical protein Y1Q_0008517 [Alligator mississippiensis]